MAKASAPEKILVLGPAWVGDMVLAQSIFKTLKKNIIEYPLELILINDSCIVHNTFTNYFIWSKQYNNCLLGLTNNNTIHNHIQSFFPTF